MDNRAKQRLKVKICGMRSPENIKSALAFMPDYLGFIFYEKSSRFVTEDQIQRIKQIDFGKTLKVGVFVNASFSRILEVVKALSLDLVQLHGDESPELVEALQREGIAVIKVFSVGDDFDLKQLKQYDSADYFLFDTKGLHRGGNGVKFDWSLLKNSSFSKPVFLSGGLGVEDVQDAYNSGIDNLFAIDVNSALETGPALKDIDKIKSLMQKI